jgi:hypothetical protein
MLGSACALNRMTDLQSQFGITLEYVLPDMELTKLNVPPLRPSTVQLGGWSSQTAICVEEG